MKKQHLAWLGGGVLFWGLLFAAGESLFGRIIGSEAEFSLLRSLGFYVVATLVLTLMVQEFIGGFISEWPPFTWFFWPLVSLIITGISVALTT